MSRRRDVERKRRNARRVRVREERDRASRIKLSNSGVYWVDMTKPPRWISVSSGKRIHTRQLVTGRFQGIATMQTRGRLLVHDARPVEPPMIYFTSKG